MIAETLTEFCTEHQREHQPREKAVRCWVCNTDTWQPHGVHEECATRVAGVR